MIEFIESGEFRKNTLRAIRKTFEAGLPAALVLDEYPGKLVRVWRSGKVEEIAYENGEIVVIEILETDYQTLNEKLKKITIE